MSKTAFVYPGQGAQRKGMLGSGFQDLLRIADDILGYSLTELTTEDPNRLLDRTDHTQPALFVANAFDHLRRTSGGNAAPDFLAGHSLGEYNALFAAGVFDFATGLRLVQKRGALMNKAVGGGMAVVVGMAERDIEKVLADNRLDLELANRNAPGQTALSGATAELQRAKPFFDRDGVRWIPLRVSAAFHSRHMKAASEEFAAYLKTVRFEAPSLPVMCNVTARPHEPDRIAEMLARHLSSPVLWTDCVGYMLDQDVTGFEEIGPGHTLAGLITKIRAERPSAAPNPAPAQVAPVAPRRKIVGTTLGSAAFRQTYGVSHAYYAGSMYKGIASEGLVVRMGRAGMLGFFGSGGLDLQRVEQAIITIKTGLTGGGVFGVNLLSNPGRPEKEMETVELFMRHGVDIVEASGFTQVSPALVRYRLAGATEASDQGILLRNKVIAKLSRPEIAEQFLSPAPEAMVAKLLSDGRITEAQAALAPRVPLADDICVEADSAGHTDRRAAIAVFPAVRRLASELNARFGYAVPVRVGLAGGIGTPEAATAAFAMGAAFIATGSINQCTAEAGISAAAKDILVQADIQDTDYCPAGDMFEIGTQVQVLKKGLLFPARANKLYELYRSHESWEDIDSQTRENIEHNYFGRSYAEVFSECAAYWSRVKPEELSWAEEDRKSKLAMVFKWYFVHTMRLALAGEESGRFDYQIHCGPALGGFNRWVRGTSMEKWQNRHADIIARQLMDATADLIDTELMGGERVGSAA